MKSKFLVITGVFVISLFFGYILDVRAESYIASSAPDSIITNHIAYDTGRMADIYAGKTITPGRDVILYNDSFNAANVGSKLNGYTWAAIIGYVYDAHIQLSYNEETKDTIAGDKIFVVDSMDYNSSYSYQKVSDSVDLGIVYIIANAESYLTKNGINPNTRTNGKLELSWFTQVTIWKYQNINGFANISVTSNDIVDHIPPLGADAYENQKTQARTTISSAITLWNLTDGLITEARNASSATIKLNYDGNFSILEENNSVRTSLISTSYSGSNPSYSLDISKAPSGTKVYNESNVQITNLTAIPNNTKFYLEIPVENIENFTYDFNITATTTYNDYTGYKYKNSSRDSFVVLVTAEPQQIHTDIDVSASHIEDSASSIPKIMYISGLFILLFGIGIVYFNIRPRKQEK